MQTLGHSKIVLCHATPNDQVVVSVIEQLELLQLRKVQSSGCVVTGCITDITVCISHLVVDRLALCRVQAVRAGFREQSLHSRFFLFQPQSSDECLLALFQFTHIIFRGSQGKWQHTLYLVPASGAVMASHVARGEKPSHRKLAPSCILEVAWTGVCFSRAASWVLADSSLRGDSRHTHCYYLMSA